MDENTFKHPDEAIILKEMQQLSTKKTNEEAHDYPAVVETERIGTLEKAHATVAKMRVKCRKR